MTAAPLAAVLGRAAGGDECDTAHDDGGNVMLRVGAELGHISESLKTSQVRAVCVELRDYT